jgi:hypothetical protein
VTNVVDLTGNLLAVRVRNAEKALLRARAAEDHYAEAAAKVAFQQVREQLAKYGAGKATGD